MPINRDAEQEAAAALAAVHRTRARLARTARWSLPRHAAFGFVMGSLVASYAMPMPLALGGLALCLALIGVIVAWDRRRDGFWVSGYRAGRPGWIAVAIGAFTGLSLVAALAVNQYFGIAWAPLAAGAVVFVVATLASIAWERAYRAELNGRR